MKELTIKELAPYFPYDLKVFNSIHLADFGVCENTIETLVGYNLGNVLTDKDEFLIEYCKPILRPLSELTKPITHNGETFVPLVKLFGYSIGAFDFEAKYVHTMASFEIQLEMLGHRNYFFSFKKDFDNDVRIDESFSHRFFCESRDLYQDDLKVEEVKNQHYLFQKLAEWHIDFQGLIDANLAIDITTLK